MYIVKKCDRRLIFFVFLFVSYYPHILQGPIARYQDFLQQLDGKKKKLSYQQLTMALQLILWGYIKKMVIADRAGIFVDNVYEQYLGVGGTVLLVASLLYTVQIYADFSGCVDIALGVSELFGIKLHSNFSQPYLSTSINDFWRRWHITLGNWFRDYLYIPLGGNRKGKIRRWFNVLIVFAVSGLWQLFDQTFYQYGVSQRQMAGTRKRCFSGVRITGKPFCKRISAAS